MLRMTFLESWTAVTASSRSLFMSTTSADSMATSVPAPMARPTSARARAGASLMPSPTMATRFPWAWSSATVFSLSWGSTSATTRFTPSWRPTASAVRGVVAGEHDHVDAHGLEGADSLCAGGLGGVGHRHHAQHPAVPGEVQRRLARLGQPLRYRVEAVQRDAGLLQHGPVARQEPLALDDAADAPARGGQKVLHRGQGDVPGLSLGGDGVGQGVLGGLLQGGGHAQKFLLRHTWGGAAVGDHRLALGEGARLVQHHGLDGVQGLQRLGGT